MASSIGDLMWVQYSGLNGAKERKLVEGGKSVGLQGGQNYLQ